MHCSYLHFAADVSLEKFPRMSALASRMLIFKLFKAIDAFGPGTVITESAIDAEVQRMNRRGGA